MINHKFNLGDKLQDKVTKYTGICLGITQYSTGCRHYGLQAEMKNKDIKPPDWEWFDENRLILIKSKAMIFTTYKPSSGNFPNPPSD